MPTIQWTRLPVALRDHLFERARERKITADRMVCGFETLGALQTLREWGFSDEDLGLTALRETARRRLGHGEAPVYVSYEVHVGICMG
jgi:hypothetical protein